MRVSLIWAMSRNRVIGKANRLPWRLPDELQYFRTTVRSHPVIMGRKTFEAVGKPFPRCLNIVLSRTQGSFAGCRHASTLREALKIASKGIGCISLDEVFVIGGARVYEEALETSDRLYRTIVEAEIEGDTFFPIYNESVWKCISSKTHGADVDHPYSFTMEVFDRIYDDSVTQ